MAEPAACRHRGDESSAVGAPSARRRRARRTAAAARARPLAPSASASPGGWNCSVTRCRPAGTRTERWPALAGATSPACPSTRAVQPGAQPSRTSRSVARLGLDDEGHVGSRRTRPRGRARRRPRPGAGRAQAVHVDGQRRDPPGRQHPVRLEARVDERGHGEDRVDRGLAQPRQDRVEVAAGALGGREDPLGGHQHREVGAEGGGHGQRHVERRGGGLEQQPEAPRLVVSPPRGARREVRRALLDAAGEDAAAAQSRQASLQGRRGPEEGRRHHRVEPRARAQQVGDDERRDHRGGSGPSRRRAQRASAAAPTARATAPPAAASPRMRARSATWSLGGDPGGKNAARERGRRRGQQPGQHGERDEEHAEDPRGPREAPPRAPVSRLRERSEADRGEEGHREMDGEEGLHREAEDAERGNRVDERRRAPTSGRATHETERDERDEAAGQGVPGPRAGPGEGQRRRPEVEADHVREAPREEVVAPPLAGDVRQVPVEPAHERLDQRERVDGVREDDVRGEASAPRAALDLAGDQEEDGRGDREAEGQREGGEPAAPPAPAAAAAGHDAGDDGLHRDLDARRGERHGRGRGRPRPRPGARGRRARAREPGRRGAPRLRPGGGRTG